MRQRLHIPNKRITPCSSYSSTFLNLKHKLKLQQVIENDRSEVIQVFSRLHNAWAIIVYIKSLLNEGICNTTELGTGLLS